MAVQKQKCEIHRGFIVCYIQLHHSMWYLARSGVGATKSKKGRGTRRDEHACCLWDPSKGRGERKDRREAYRRGDPPEGRASRRGAAAGGGWRARRRLLARLRADARGSLTAQGSRLAWGRVTPPGRPYPCIGSIGYSSKWAVSHLRPTRWPISLAIVGRASDRMARPGPFSS